MANWAYVPGKPIAVCIRRIIDDGTLGKEVVPVFEKDPSASLPRELYRAARELCPEFYPRGPEADDVVTKPSPGKNSIADERLIVMQDIAACSHIKEFARNYCYNSKEDARIKAVHDPVFKGRR